MVIVQITPSKMRLAIDESTSSTWQADDGATMNVVSVNKDSGQVNQKFVNSLKTTRCFLPQLLIFTNF